LYKTQSQKISKLLDALLGHAVSCIIAHDRAQLVVIAYESSLITPGQTV
jgi:hypothetical protein